MPTRLETIPKIVLSESVYAGCQRLSRVEIRKEPKLPPADPIVDALTISAAVIFRLVQKQTAKKKSANHPVRSS